MTNLDDGGLDLLPCPCHLRACVRADRLEVRIEGPLADWAQRDPAIEALTRELGMDAARVLTGWRVLVEMIAERGLAPGADVRTRDATLWILGPPPTLERLWGPGGSA